MVETVEDVDALIARARRLSEGGARRILGITGCPGAGKSTVAEGIVGALGVSAVLVPMDGFHLGNAELERLGRRDRKGAPDTFDAAGYVALLRRLRAAEAGETVYAPEFHREIEEAVAGAIAVPPEVPLVVTEGIYLLLDEGPWPAVRGLVDEIWYVELGDSVRVPRLLERHIRFGKSPAEARAWVARSDEANAALIRPTRDRADLIVRLLR